MISTWWRLVLAAKALLLLAIAAGFFWIARAALEDSSAAIKALGGAGFGALGLFIVWAAAFGLADAVTAGTRTEDGVKVLESRRQGYSMRAQALYRVTYGRYSGVIVARPVPTTLSALRA